MKEIRLWELALLIVILFVVGSIGFFWYERGLNSYMLTQETFRREVTVLLNYNIQQGRLLTQGTPSIIPQPIPKEGKK